MGLGGKRVPGEHDKAIVAEQREIVCASEVGAKAEAERQQAAELDERAEWIYLRNATEMWVARRVDRYAADHEPVSFKRAAKEEAANLLNPLEWPWLFIP
jgi:hypothetical protein